MPVCRYKGLCMKRAEEAGIATARLPITKYVQLDSRAVLTVNHVVQVRGGGRRGGRRGGKNEGSPTLCSYGGAIDDMVQVGVPERERGHCSHALRKQAPLPRITPPPSPSPCMQIMVEMFNRHDWQLVLDMVLPPRKRADFKSTKAKAKEQADAAEEKHEAEEQQVETAAASEQQADNDMAAEAMSEPKEQDVTAEAKEPAQADEQQAAEAKQHADVKGQVVAEPRTAEAKDKAAL